MANPTGKYDADSFKMIISQIHGHVPLFGCSSDAGMNHRIHHLLPSESFHISIHYFSFFFPNFFNIFRIYFLNFFGAGWTVSEGNGLNNRCDSRHGNWIETWMQYATATGATVAALMTLRGSRNRRGKHLIVKHRQHPRQKNKDYKMKSLIWFNVDWTGRRQGAPVPIQIEPNQFDNNRNISEFDFDGRRDKGNCRNSTPPPPP